MAEVAYNLTEKPFGLVPVEAMACGTPIIAFKRGALQETVKSGVIGYLVKNQTEMSLNIKQVDKISRLTCREWVEKNFTVNTMTDAYESLYNKTISKNA